MFNAFTGVWGINDLHIRTRFSLVAIGFLLACIVVWESAQQNWENDQQMANISGDDSYPAVVPQPLENSSIPLMIYNRGTAILSGVTITIEPPGNFLPTTWKVIEVGVLSPNQKNTFNVTGRLLSSTITPNIDEKSITVDGEKVDSYLFYMTAQNGSVTELLQFNVENASRGHIALRYTD